MNTRFVFLSAHDVHNGQDTAVGSKKRKYGEGGRLETFFKERCTGGRTVPLHQAFKVLFPQCAKKTWKTPQFVPRTEAKRKLSRKIAIVSTQRVVNYIFIYTCRNERPIRTWLKIIYCSTFVLCNSNYGTYPWYRSNATVFGERRQAGRQVESDDADLYG